MQKIAKEKLRAQTKMARKSLEAKLKAQFEQQIRKQLYELPEFNQAHNILFYHSIADEVDTLVIMQDLLDQKESARNAKSIILPRIITNNQLMLHQINSLKDLQVNGLGIFEPSHNCPRVEPSTVDLVLIPGLAFDLHKHRLGYGKGYYDRLLKDMHCPKIGLAYELQIVKDVHREDHDVQLDMIITEQRIIL